MDHQVQDCPNIGRPAGERAVSFALDEFGSDWPTAQCFKSRIEALDVPDLQDRALAAGQVHDLRGLFDRWRHRLFDKQRDAAFQESGGDGVVMARRHDDAGGIRRSRSGP